MSRKLRFPFRPRRLLCCPRPSLPVGHLLLPGAREVCVSVVELERRAHPLRRLSHLVRPEGERRHVVVVRKRGDLPVDGRRGGRPRPIGARRRRCAPSPSLSPPSRRRLTAGRPERCARPARRRALSRRAVLARQRGGGGRHLSALLRARPEPRGGPALPGRRRLGGENRRGRPLQQLCGRLGLRAGEPELADRLRPAEGEDGDHHECEREEFDVALVQSDAILQSANEANG